MKKKKKKIPNFLSHENLAFWRQRFLTNTDIHFIHTQSTIMIEERYYQKIIILIGHSMGGFVARVIVVLQELRKSYVQTLLTLSSPHR